MDESRWRWSCDEKGCYFKDRWMLTELDGALPHGAQFGDLDGWTEINSQFLFIEHKPAGWQWDQNNGQWKALKRLARLPGVTVWWIRDQEDGYELAVPGQPLAVVTAEGLRERITAWGEWAETLDA
jgi:hypothetical protein